MNNPATYRDQSMSAYFNMQPSEVKGTANVGVLYWKRILYMKIYSVFKFTIPETWDKNYFLSRLFCWGSTGVIYTKEYGWVNQPYSVIKWNLYYNPAVITVFNSFITKEKTGIIGVNAGIIHACPDYYGLDDIVTRFAEKLAQCDKSIDINLMNANVALIYEAEDKKSAEAMLEAHGQATTGKPLVTVNKDLLKGSQLKTLINQVGQNFIALDILQLQNSIMNQFLTTIGIKNANYDKKERLNSAEVNENNDDTQSIISVIYETIRFDMERINAFSGLGLNIEYAYNYSDESEVNENATNYA